MEALTQQMSTMFSRFEAGQQGQQQRPPTSAQMQTSAPQQPIHRPSGATYNQHQQFFCYECGAQGHISRNCERRRQATSQGPNQPPDRVRLLVNARMPHRSMATASNLEDGYRRDNQEKRSSVLLKTKTMHRVASICRLEYQERTTELYWTQAAKLQLFLRS